MSDQLRPQGASPADAESPSRRSFLKSSTAAVVGGGLVGALGAPRAVHAGADETLKVGVVGCGGRGSGAAANALRAKANVKLVAVGDAYQDRLEGSLAAIQKNEEFKDRVDVPKERQFVGFDAYQKVIDAGVDVVILATPPGFRPIHFKAAIDAGKHVFMEKPVAVDAPGVRSVLESAEAAKQKGLAVGVGLQRHHQNSYIETINRLQDGAIGDITSMRAYWNGAGVWVHPRKPGQSEMDYQMRNWYYFNWLCGDHIVEQHIHNLDVCNWLKGGPPIRAEGMGGRQVRVGKDYGEIYDHHAVEFEYADGSRMFSYCRHIPNCWNSVSEHCQGTKGEANIGGATINPNEGTRWRFRGDSPNPYDQEHEDLYDSILAGEPLNEGEFGALSTMTSILGRMCTYSGRMINWDEALASELSLAPKEYSWDATPPVPSVAVPGQTRVI